MSTATRRPVVVVGSGLAGLTAALDLAEAGVDVLVLEARSRFGGATSTFARAAAGTRPALLVDTGQHVALRCYDAWRGLLRRLGTDDLLEVQPRLSIPVRYARDGAVARSVLRRDPLPAPAHLLRALTGYRVLSPARRIAAARAAVALRGVDPAAAGADLVPFGTWLRAHGQDAATIEAVWDLFTVAACNAGADEVSLAVAARVLIRALLTTADAADIAVPTAPLAALHVDPAVHALRAAGARVLRRTPVRAVLSGPDGLLVRTDDGDIAAAGVVCAVPAHTARALLPEQVDLADGLEYAPIVNVHVVYDRTVTADPFLATVGSDAQWVFDRTTPSGLAATHPRAQYLAVSLSAAGRWIGVPADELVDRFVGELARLLPGAAHATVLDAFVTRERRATFVAAPGAGALRPPARTAVRGLVLAGAWTATGLPDTMEGAVVSGHAAAGQLLGDGGGRVGAAAGPPGPPDRFADPVAHRRDSIPAR